MRGPLHYYLTYCTYLGINTINILRPTSSITVPVYLKGATCTTHTHEVLARHKFKAMV